MYLFTIMEQVIDFFSGLNMIIPSMVLGLILYLIFTFKIRSFENRFKKKVIIRWGSFAPDTKNLKALIKDETDQKIKNELKSFFTLLRVSQFLAFIMPFLIIIFLLIFNIKP